jgi:hypothetical protein
MIRPLKSGVEKNKNYFAIREISRFVSLKFVSRTLKLLAETNRFFDLYGAVIYFIKK